MKKILASLFAVIGWFGVVAQFVIMIESRTQPVGETIVRFFSYFTILTNILVATYFTAWILPERIRPTILNRTGTLTAVTVYIIMVGSVYQIMLRHIWQPQGLQMIVDEILHSAVPVFVIIFWALYEEKDKVMYSSVVKWFIYPLVYLAFIMIRGQFSDFYPYYFIDASKIGIGQALLTSGILLMIFMATCTLVIAIGLATSRSNDTQLK